MKIRTDFVTNSSSSSFIIARNEEFTEKQKEIILNYVAENFLGGRTEITEENMERILQGRYNANKLRKNIKRAFAEGKKVYQGSVCFEEERFGLGQIYKDLWKNLEEAEPDSFDEIAADFGIWDEGVGL